MATMGVKGLIYKLRLLCTHVDVEFCVQPSLNKMFIIIGYAVGGLSFYVMGPAPFLPIPYVAYFIRCKSELKQSLYSNHCNGYQSTPAH